MYCMLSSSQPLIKTFISFDLSHSFWKWLGFWFSRSFAKGLWLLDLINRKTFLWIFLGSPLHLVFLDGDWKVFYFLAFEKLLWDLYLFLGIFVLSTGGRLQLRRFCKGTSTRLDCLHFYQGVFISVIAIYDLLLLFFCSIFLFSHDAANLIWLTFVVQERGRIGSLGENVGHKNCSNLLKLIKIVGIIIIKASTRFSR